MLSSPNESFFSFDCFIEGYEIKLFAPSNSLFKLFLYMFLPIILILIISFAILLMKCILHSINKQKSFYHKRAIVVSFIGIVFLFHPTLTIESLSVFLCNQIDENDYKMTHHMEYKCYSFEHLTWVTLVGLPILIVWVFGCPLVAFIILTKNRSKLEDWSIKKYFLILYQGFKPEVYYWEFVNTSRKFSILAISSLMNSLSVNYQLMASISKFSKLIVQLFWLLLSDSSRDSNRIRDKTTMTLNSRVLLQAE